MPKVKNLREAMKNTNKKNQQQQPPNPTKKEGAGTSASKNAAATTINNQDGINKKKKKKKNKKKGNASNNGNNNNNDKNNNNKNNSSTIVTDKNGTKLSDIAVLAPNFVPDAVRRVLFLPVRSSYYARALPDMMVHTNRLYHASLPLAPQCVCPTRHPVGYPALEMPVIQLDHYFALRPENTTTRSLPDFQLTFPTLDTAKRKDDYLNILQSLIQEEFTERMMLYERYTQYQAEFQYQKQDSPKKLAEGQVTLLIPGIHNARPALEPGDQVLMRPQLDSTTAATNSTVQIHAQVLRTVRGNWNSKKRTMEPDQVVITWLPRPDTKTTTPTTPSSSSSSSSSNIWNELVFQRGQKMVVRFLPSTTHLQRSIAALHWIRGLDPHVARELLFPTETPQIKQHYYSPKNELDDDLNEKQSRFVSMVLTRTKYPSTDKVRPPMILTGPAGTGKTKTLLASLLKVLQQQEEQQQTKEEDDDDGHYRHEQKRILVCTPSHTACDVICRRLSQSLSPKKLFRMYPSDRPVEMIPVELLPYVSQGKDGEFILPPGRELLKFQVIVCTCSDAQLLVMAGVTNARLRIRRQCLKNLALHLLKAGDMSVPSNNSIHGAEEPHFSHLFIDEAAQATEPESLIPLSVVVDDCPSSATTKVEICLAGDPRQLSPDIYSPWAAPGLQSSLLERLLRLPEVGGRSHMMGPPTEDSWTSMAELIEYSFQKKEDHDHLSVFLTTSYRGHPSFLLMPSKFFYFGKLRSSQVVPDDVNDKWCSVLRKIEATSTIVKPPTGNCEKQESWPIHFRGVYGKDQSAAVESFWGSNSWSNPVEAREILQIVKTIVAEGISTQSIGIMAAFRGQVVLIRQVLRAEGLGAVNVGIVEDYQAVERKVIILSLTRCNPNFLSNDVKRRLGLFQQEKRMNVALTRAENMLVVVGDPRLMEKDPLWKQWLEFCFHNGLWYGKQGNGAAGAEGNGNPLVLLLDST